MQSTWRQHANLPHGDRTHKRPDHIRDRFLIESGIAAQGFELKLGYASQMLKDALSQRDKRRGLVHPDELPPETLWPETKRRKRND